tara:strand:+ start:128 stop:274 length:147 start_codon:yes stop_codon:yes gene_type:complete
LYTKEKTLSELLQEGFEKEQAEENDTCSNHTDERVAEGECCKYLQKQK